MNALGLSTVRVAEIAIADALMRQVIDALTSAPEAAILVYALHVGGLNVASLPEVRDAYAQGDMTYADGAAVVLLARLAGGRSIERTPTTDLGPLLLDALGEKGEVRLSLLGGPPGLAEAAGHRLSADHPVTVVGTMSGYDVQPSEFLRLLDDTRPNVVIVGLGSPQEMLFLSGLRGRLPSALYLTCGGWFGFLAGDEKRAPSLRFSQRIRAGGSC